MAETVIVKTWKEHQQDQGDKALGILLIIGLLAFTLILYFTHKYLTTKLGLNSNAAIMVMISIPLIFVILLYKGKKIYWFLNSLSKNKHTKEKYWHENKKGLFWLGVILFLIVIILFLQYKSFISSAFDNYNEKVNYNSFLDEAQKRGYPKDSTLSDSEAKELCNLRCNGKWVNQYANDINFNIVECGCGNDYIVDVKTLKDISIDELQRRSALWKAQQNSKEAPISTQSITPEEKAETAIPLEDSQPTCTPTIERYNVQEFYQNGKLIGTNLIIIESTGKTSLKIINDMDFSITIHIIYTMSSTWLGNQAREYTEIINSKDSKTIEDPASVSCSTIPCGISDLRYDIINPEGITSETKELERIIGC